MSRLSFRPLHSKGGSGDLCFRPPDNRHLITAGADGLIALLTDLAPLTSESGDPSAAVPTSRSRLLKDAGDLGVLSVACHPLGTSLCVSQSSRLVELYDFPLLDLTDRLRQDDLESTCVCFSPTGSFVSCASEGGVVRLLNAITPQSAPVECRPPHSGPCLGVAWDPLNAFVASVGSDGVARLYDANTGDQVGSFEFPKPPRRGVGLRGFRPAWRPDGSALALPGGSECVPCLERGSWRVAMSLGDGCGTGAKGVFVCSVAWSPNGRYLVASSSDGRLEVWDTTARESVNSARVTNAPAVAVAWGVPGIAVMDSKGQIALWEDVVPRSMPSAVAAGQSGASSAPAIRPIQPSDLFSPGDAVDALDDTATMQAVLAAEQKLSEVGTLKCPGLVAVPPPVAAALTAGDPPRAAAPAAESAPPAGTIDTRMGSLRHLRAFQPCESPAEKQRRFLAYNGVGWVVCREDQNGSVVTVEFADTSKNRRFTLSDPRSICMGSLGTHFLALASKRHVSFRPHVEATKTRPEVPSCEWFRDLPDSEDVCGLAVGDSSVCVVTSKGFLRFFSPSGMQLPVLQHGAGKHVCIASRGDFFVQVTATPGPVLHYLLLSSHPAGAHPVVHDSGVMPCSSLEWLGFSDDMAVCVVDSAGVLSMKLKGANAWMPMVDFGTVRKHKSEWHWVVGVTEAEVLYVLCKDDQRCPPAAPAPMVDAVAITPPVLIEGDGAGSKKLTDLVVQRCRASSLQLHRMTADRRETPEPSELVELDTAVLGLIKAQLAVTTGEQHREARVLGLCCSLKLGKSLLIAAKYATKAGLSRLSDSIVAMAPGPVDPQKRAAAHSDADAPDSKRPRH